MEVKEDLTGSSLAWLNCPPCKLSPMSPLCALSGKPIKGTGSLQHTWVVWTPLPLASRELSFEIQIPGYVPLSVLWYSFPSMLDLPLTG